MFSSGPRYQKLSTNLRLVINRLKLLEKKNTELAVKARREISEYLTAGKDDRARIRVEHIIRDDYLVEAMEMVEMYCDLLLARMGLIQTTKELDEGLEEPIASVIWATPRLQGDVPELRVVCEQLTAKYGKEFATSCRSNILNNVNEKLMLKLSVHAPAKKLIDRYLEEIARTYNISFVAPPDDLETGSDVLIDDGMLIDFSDPNKGASGLPPMIPGEGVPPPVVHPAPFQYPMPHAPPFTDPNDKKPPTGGVPSVGPPPAGMQPPPAGFNLPPSPPNYTDLNSSRPASNNSVGPPPPGVTTSDFDLPELPTVPTDTFSVITNRDGSGVDFDDLTKRFEALRKK